MAKGSAGKEARLYTTGASTGMVDEATTELTATTFQITDTARRILDDDVAIVVEVTSVVQDPSTYTIDPNFGVVTFDSSQTGLTVVITGSYLPRFLVAKLKNVALEDAWDTADSTTLGDDAEDNTLTIRRAKLTGETLTVDDVVHTTESLNDIFNSETLGVFEFQPRLSTDPVARIRGFLNDFAYKNSATGLVTIDFGTVSCTALQGDGVAALISWGLAV